MTAEEFENLKIGDQCVVMRGKDKGLRCTVVHKEQGGLIKGSNPVSMVVLVKPSYPHCLFNSPMVCYRFFKLFSHRELRVIA